MRTCDPSQCPICKGTAKRFRKGNFDAYVVICDRCGDFGITDTALVNIRGEYFSEREIANASGWLRENQGYEITSYNADGLKNINPISYSERADRLLRKIGKVTSFAGEEVKIDSSWISSAWCAHEKEMRSLLNFLSESDLVVVNGPLPEYQTVVVRPNGWMRIDDLSKVGSAGDQGFVAMWFDQSMSEAYAVAISKAIADAGYRPHRVDNREHNGKIDDEIVSEIRKSRFVVADFSGHRGGVYYEAGFAKCLGIEVFWTCREDYFKELHFDIRQYNCIEWKMNELDEFRQRLRFRIESVLGQGPVKK